MNELKDKWDIEVDFLINELEILKHILLLSKCEWKDKRKIQLQKNISKLKNRAFILRLKINLYKYLN